MEKTIVRQRLASYAELTSVFKEQDVVYPLSSCSEPALDKQKREAPFPQRKGAFLFNRRITLLDDYLIRVPLYADEVNAWGLDGNGPVRSAVDKAAAYGINGNNVVGRQTRYNDAPIVSNNANTVKPDRAYA